MAFAWNVPAAADYVLTTNQTTCWLPSMPPLSLTPGGANRRSGKLRFITRLAEIHHSAAEGQRAGRIIIFGENGSTPNSRTLTTGSPTASVLYVGIQRIVHGQYCRTLPGLSGAPLAASDYMPGIRCAPQAAATWRVNYAEFADGVVILLSQYVQRLGGFGAGRLDRRLDCDRSAHGLGLRHGGSTAWATTATAIPARSVPASVGRVRSYDHGNAGLLVRDSSTNRQVFRAFGLGTNIDAKLNNPSATSCCFSRFIRSITSDATLNVVGKMRQIGFGPRCDRETTRSGGGVSAYGHQ